MLKLYAVLLMLSLVANALLTWSHTTLLDEHMRLVEWACEQGLGGHECGES